MNNPEFVLRQKLGIDANHKHLLLTVSRPCDYGLFAMNVLNEVPATTMIVVGPLYTIEPKSWFKQSWRNARPHSHINIGHPIYDRNIRHIRDLHEIDQETLFEMASFMVFPGDQSKQAIPKKLVYRIIEQRKSILTCASYKSKNALLHHKSTRVIPDGEYHKWVSCINETIIKLENKPRPQKPKSSNDEEFMLGAFV